MTQIQQHTKNIEALINEIKTDPILNALVENDLLTKLSNQVDCLLHDCLDEYSYLREENISLKEKIDDLTDDMENLKYENDRLNEVIY